MGAERAGGHAHPFEEPDLAAFWDAVVSEGLRAPADTRRLLGTLTVDRPGLLLDLELDGRSVVSGLRDVVAVLGPDEHVEGYRRTLVRIGGSVARARGPYGRQIGTEDLSRLLLVAQLLDYSPPRADAA